MMNFVLFCLWNAAIIKVIEQKRTDFLIWPEHRKER